MSIEDLLDPVAAQVEEEVLTSRRAFYVSQAEWAGATLRVVANFEPVAWHSNVVHPEVGPIAVVQAGGPWADLVGEIVRVRRRMPPEDRIVLVYVVASAAIPSAFSISRRAFMELGPLALSSVSADLEIVA